MKICPNCDVDGMVAYDDRVRQCPICGAELIPDPYSSPPGEPAQQQGEPAAGSRRTEREPQVYEMSEDSLDFEMEPGVEETQVEENTIPHLQPELIPSMPDVVIQNASEASANRRRGAASRTRNTDSASAARSAAPRFHWRQGGREFYRGSVAEVTPVIRYASGPAKVFQSVFMGVPYQVGHSTTYMKIRIEEHVPDMTRFPERNLTVEYQSDAEGELIYGDDITIEAVSKRNKFVAKNIWVNENSGRRKLGKGMEIPAIAIRLFFLTLIAMIVSIGFSIYNFVHSPMFSELVVTVILVLTIIYVIVTAIRPRRRW